jgi:hypothetical protein
MTKTTMGETALHVTQKGSRMRQMAAQGQMRQGVVVALQPPPPTRALLPTPPALPSAEVENE